MPVEPPGGILDCAERLQYRCGTCYDTEGRIVCCEQTTHRIVRMHDDGSGYEVMASHYADLELNGPNDLAVHANGGIYFRIRTSAIGRR